MTVTSAMCSVPSSSQSLLSNGGSPHHISRPSSALNSSTGKKWPKEDSPTNSITGGKSIINADNEPLVRPAWHTQESLEIDSNADDLEGNAKVDSDDPEGQTLLASENTVDPDAMTIVAQDDQDPDHSDNNLVVSSQECQCPRHDDDYIFVNVRGIRFAVFSSHLAKRPKSRLAMISKSDANFSVCDDEFYFDRNPTVFNSLLDFYSQGEMHLPTNICIQAFRRELEYWRLEPELLAPCCWSKYRKAEEEERTLARVQKEWGTFGARIYTDVDEHGNKVPTKQKIWLFLNEPQTSFGAKVKLLYHFTIDLFSSLRQCSIFEDTRLAVCCMIVIQLSPCNHLLEMRLSLEEDLWIKFNNEVS